MNQARHFALIPAAGVGARLGASCPKQYLDIAGRPMLAHVLSTFAQCQRIEHSFVVTSPDDGYIDAVVANEPTLAGRVTVCKVGGATRHASVLNGLTFMAPRMHPDDWVLVHDAARPGLSVGLIERLVNAVGPDAVGGILALPVVDTIKRSDEHHCSVTTVDRSELWAAQTPQMFRHAMLSHALAVCEHVTDEASAIEAIGHRPQLVMGDFKNFKVTLPHDVELARLLLEKHP